jgi:hypothetical protein
LSPDEAQDIASLVGKMSQQPSSTNPFGDDDD